MEHSMKSSKASHHALRLLSVAAMFALWAQSAGAATTVVYSFQGEEDGEYPATELVVDAIGNLYGTTTEGGDFNAGTVFRLTPDGAGWTKTVLHNFNGFSDGLNPYGGVAIDAQGNLYGTTTAGGSGGICAEDGCGVVFKLTKQGDGYVFGVIHDFTGCNDGWGAGGQPALDATGNVYGTTPNGGRNSIGVVYQLSPNGGGYAFRVIHAFTGGDDGGTGGLGRLLVDGAGKNIFGVATVGGAHGAGVAYRLRLMPNGQWLQKTIYAFRGAPDAGFPYGGLSADRAGNLYGTTYYDGENGYGTVYQLSPSGGGEWTERVLHSFAGGTDGNNPSTNLLFDARGNIYGTTAEGGSPGCDCGTIFKLSHDDNGNWSEHIAYRFQGVPDGAYSYYSLVSDHAGHFYGATVHGGDDNDGAIYQFTP
jgi:uncharacterized repeat protein (TIGR03803 family)